MIVRVSMLLSLACLLAIAACKTSAPPPAITDPNKKGIIELSAEGVQNAQIRAVRVSPQAFVPRLLVTATINADPKDIARLGARVTGRVGAIHVRLGDHVQKGQPLLEIDAVELHQVSTEFLTAMARARLADDTLSRQRQLVAERVGAVQDLRRAEAEASAASATLHEADEHLRFLGLSEQSVRALREGKQHGGQERSVLRSPIDGQIGALTVSLGQVLTGTEDLVTVTRTDRVWASLQIYERDLASVAPGTKVEVRVPTYADRKFPGEVTAVSDLIDSANKTAEARVSVPNPDGLLKPGMSAVAAVELKSKATGLWLPSDAVQRRGTERIVFVKVAERRFEARPISVGEEQGGMILVPSGISQGEQVVVEGAFALRGELERSELEE